MTAVMFMVLKMNAIAALMVLLTVWLGRLTKGRYSSKWKYYMWLAIMVFLLLPVDFSGRSPLKIEFTGEEAQSAGSAAAAESTGSAATAKSIENMSSTVPVGGMESTENIAGATVREKQESVYRISYGHFPMEKLLYAAGILWLPGIIVFGILRALRYYFSLHKMMRWSYAASDERMQELYFRICRKKHIKNPPKLLVAEGLSSPMLAGIRHPGLYVPEKHFNMEEMEFIFSHELSHYVRHDLWYKMFMLVVTTIYWFNPALYLMQREAEKDIENLCDGKMAYHYTSKDRMKYGKLLLKIAAEQNQIPYMSVGFSNGKEVFKDRILYMKNLRKLKEKIFPAVMLVGIMAGAQLLVGVSVNVAEAAGGELVDFQSGTENDGTVETGGKAGESVDLVVDNQENSQDKEIELKIVQDEENKGTSETIDPENQNQQTEEQNPAAADNNNFQPGENGENISLTGEQKTVWALDGSFADYIYLAADGNWYDGSGRLYLPQGGEDWIQASSGISMSENAPERPSESAVSSVYVTDDSGYNSQTLYQGTDGQWLNDASGAYTDNGNGTFTGPDGEIWYQN